MEKSFFEQMGGTYTLGEDGMFYPDLALPEDEAPRYGKYGRMRLAFLREHRWAAYAEFLIAGMLAAHLNEIDAAANERMELLTRQMAEHRHVDEVLKARDQLGWVGAMNNIRSAAEEIVLNELIFS